ncbi:hypothetical protein HDU97_000509 [Phlyctochytrium planicorne]|nr:hypothetical protein HDU97_000509 [Phlyctochytrium planicorne]
MGVGEDEKKLGQEEPSNQATNTGDEGSSVGSFNPEDHSNASRGSTPASDSPPPTAPDNSKPQARGPRRQSQRQVQQHQQQQQQLQKRSRTEAQDQNNEGAARPKPLRKSISSPASATKKPTSIYDPVPVFPASATNAPAVTQKHLPHLPQHLQSSASSSSSSSSSNSTSLVTNASPSAPTPTMTYEDQSGGFAQPSPPTNGVDSIDDKGKKRAPKRRKVSQACVYCRRSHMTCDEGRPCQRCIKRKIAHLCHDESKGPGGGGPGAHGESSVGTFESDHELGIGPSQAATAASEMVAAAAAAVASGASLPPAIVAAVANALPNLSGAMMDPNSGAPIAGDPQGAYTFPALSAFPPLFASEHMGNEFTILTDFLASLDEMNGGQQFRGLRTTRALQDVVASGGSSSEHGVPSSTSGLGISDPSSQLSSTEKFVLTAADPGDGTYDDRLNQVITAKFEAGLLKPYNYVNSYARLQKWMETHMSPASRARILNVMGVFRPKFRWIAQSLTDIDLVLVEEAFERLLLEYDRVFSSMGIPSCLWRRTGEICKCNKEFASLVGLPMEKLRDGKVHIYELMSEESAVNYWEKYGNIAFDAGQKAVLTSCVLKGINGRKNVNCCFSFTIRRDRYNIPLMIAGNFLLAAD